MAYQITIALNYSELIDFSEGDFTVFGPGARRDIRKCFVEYGRSESDVIHWIVDHQEVECRCLDLDPPSLWDRRLSASDCQNLFCETDKYARAAFP